MHGYAAAASRKAATRILRSERGIALISVLWILVLLTAIVGEFSYSMRTEINISRNFKEATQAYYIAHAGLMRSVVEIIKNTTGLKDLEGPNEIAESSIWRVNFPIPAKKIGAGEFTAHIDNAAGLIDLNAANVKLLTLMVNTLYIRDHEKDVIVDSILDWRDNDDLHRLNGAESDYYQSLADPYACKNAAFDSIEELMLVRGMTAKLFYKHLKPIVTITPGSKTGRSGKRRSSSGAAAATSGRININAAPRRLLEALPQITSLQVQNIMDYRADKDVTSTEEILGLLGDFTYLAVSPYITLSLSPFYTIRADGRVSGSSARQAIQAMVKIDARLTGGYKIVRWMDQYY